MKPLRLLLLLLMGCLASSASAQQQEQWMFVSPLAAPRAGTAAAVLDGKIYVLGGQDGRGKALNTAIRYDPKADRWETLPPMREARLFAAATAYRGGVYVMGGRDADDKVLDDVEFYDPAENKWASFDHLSVERQGHIAVLRGEALFVAGGSNQQDQLLGSIETYTADAGTWAPFEGGSDTSGVEVELTGIIQALGVNSLTVNDTTFVLTNDTEILNAGNAPIGFSTLAVGVVVEVRAISNAIGEFEATRIQVEDDGGTGGGATPPVAFCTSGIDLNVGDTFTIRDYIQHEDGTPITDWSQIYFTYTEAAANDPTTPPDWNLDAFNAGQPVTIVAADAAEGTGNHGDGEYRIYAARTGHNEADDDLTFRIDNDRDSEVDEARCTQAAFKSAGIADLNIARASFAAVSVQGEPILMGGFTRSGPVDLVQGIYNDGSIGRLPPLPSPRGSLSAAAIGDSVFVFGGIDGFSQVLSDVHLLDFRSQRWLTMPRMNASRESSAAVAVGGTVYVIGGRDAGGRVLASVEALVVDTRTATDEPATPPDFFLAPAYPNPFRTTTTITFQVPAQSSNHPVRLSIYNVQGRLVMRLIDGVLRPGAHRITWDGRSVEGTPVSSGVYLCRLQHGDRVAHQMMTIAR